MKKFILIFTMILSFSVFALDLSDAKQQGLVGEKVDGLLGVVKSSREVNQLVQSINAQRIELYKEIAEKNGMTLEQVSVLAGKKAISKTPRGEYIQNSAGQWEIK
ncbi:YdbL family protein [Psychromonas sp.]|uniref:YdbL family protein n=1 Tax=Psychromonas sp. TaxID=1884585 RepID=UPI00356867AA